MRAGPNPIHAALLLPAALLAACPARAQPGLERPRPGQHHPRASADMDRTLARMAEAARRDWRVRHAPPLPPPLAPATRERVAAPPFTGWGYGGTIPGVGPGF